MNTMVPARLDIERQVVVGNAVAAALAVSRPEPILPGSRSRGEALVAATVNLHLFTGHRPKEVDLATDTAIVATDTILEHQERALSSRVVPLGEPQREALARFQMVRGRLFPRGTNFIRKTMDLQWSDLLALRAAALDPEVAAAIDAAGLRPYELQLEQQRAAARAAVRARKAQAQNQDDAPAPAAEASGAAPAGS